MATAAGQPCQLQQFAPRRVPLAHVEAEMVVQKTGQARPKRQPVTATVSATPLRMRPPPGVCTPSLALALAPQRIAVNAVAPG
ncbi:MAG: hypothetical protein IT429_25585 [Gemmataceae bacterium]|nr:hypothetical protein [Gemmataceae bacterium]